MTVAKASNERRRATRARARLIRQCREEIGVLGIDAWIRGIVAVDGAVAAAAKVAS